MTTQSGGSHYRIFFQKYRVYQRSAKGMHNFFNPNLFDARQHFPMLPSWAPGHPTWVHLGTPLDPYGFMVGAHGRLMGSTLAPHGPPWLPQMVFCVNLNRNLTGQLGTYCKLTEPILPFSGFKLPLDTLVAARAMPIVGEKVKVRRPRWLKRGYYFVKCRPFRSPPRS